MSASRRAFLRYIAASPLLAATSAPAGPIANPAEAINVMDFEDAAQKALPPAHWGYLATGVEDDATLRANRSGFGRYYLRPRRLVDTTRLDTRTDVLGIPWACPIALAPVGNMGAFHPEAELPVARAARENGIVQFLSTYTNTHIRDVAKAHGSPVWYQLYAQANWQVTERLVRIAEEAGAPAIVLTVDTQAGRRTDTQERWRKLDTRDCNTCHAAPRNVSFFSRKAMFTGIDKSLLGRQAEGLTWEAVQRLRKLTSRKLLVKGIDNADDARLCLENGADGIVVSNHGGRAAETGRGTIECLEEVVDAVGGRGAVLIDGGFRRGSDVFKALALGARGVLIGRPYIWGLAAFGEPGVLRVLSILRGELELVMKQCGVASVAQIGPAYIGRRQA